MEMSHGKYSMSDDGRDIEHGVDADEKEIAKTGIKGRGFGFVFNNLESQGKPARKPRVRRRGNKWYTLSVFLTSFLESVFDRHAACFVPCGQTVRTEGFVSGKESITCGTRVELELGGGDAARDAITSACN